MRKKSNQSCKDVGKPSRNTLNSALIFIQLAFIGKFSMNPFFIRRHVEDVIASIQMCSLGTDWHQNPLSVDMTEHLSVWSSFSVSLFPTGPLFVESQLKAGERSDLQRLRSTVCRGSGCDLRSHMRSPSDSDRASIEVHTCRSSLANKHPKQMSRQPFGVFISYVFFWRACLHMWRGSVFIFNLLVLWDYDSITTIWLHFKLN